MAGGRALSRALERVALGALVFLATSNRPLGRVAGLTLRPDWASGALAVLIVLLALLARRRLPLSPALLGFGGFVAFQLFSSVANRGAWPEGVKFSLIYILALAYLCATLILVRDADTAHWVLSLVLVLAVVEASVSVLAVLSSNLIGVPSPGPMLPRVFPRAEGAMSEANLFSSFLLVPFSVALWRWSARPRPAKLQGAACLALTAGLIFGLTRAAWIASLAVGWLSPLRLRPARVRVCVLLASAAVATGLLLGSDLVLRHGRLERTGLYDRLATGVLTGFDEPLDTRRTEMRASVASWRTSPWVGHGAGSANTLIQDPGNRWRRPTKPWISNVFLFVLHDAGLVGLVLFLSTLGAAAYQWWRARGGFGDRTAALDHEALGIGLGAVLLAWQTTHGLWQMYGYLYLGLLLALSRLASPSPARAAPGTPSMCDR
jgi:O-antigen ligase